MTMTMIDEIARQREEIERLRREKEILSRQVVRLVRAEGRLYQYQEQLDAQLKEYEDLYELNRALNATLELDCVFDHATHYIVKLGYQRVVFLQLRQDGRGYTVRVAEGYYGEREKRAIGQLEISLDDPVLSPLRAGGEFVMCNDKELPPPLAEFGRKILMDEYLLYRLGSADEPAALLMVGNRADRAEYYRKVTDKDGLLLGIGNIVGLISSTIDTRRAIEKKRLAEAKYLSIFLNASEGIFQTSPQGRFLSCNPATAAILGYATPEEVMDEIHDIGTQLYVRPQRRRELYALIRSGALTGSFEAEFYRKDGSRCWVSISPRPHFDENGKLLHVDGILRDITARKRAEEEIRSLNVELEQRVKTRTTQLEEAYREQESFNYSVSHDLRAPLRHINSFSAILIEELHETLPEEHRGYLERICQASSRMGKLIDDLLALSKVGLGKLKFDQVDMTQIANEIVTMLRETEPWRIVTVEIADRLTVRGDYNLVKMALQNLIGNAWKYTAHTPYARIEFGRMDEGGETVFFVRDNGAGFDMAYANKLFGAFQRLHGSEYDGSGIGLATVQRIINRHGSRIWAEGRVGFGATFYFALPVDPDVPSRPDHFEPLHVVPHLTFYGRAEGPACEKKASGQDKSVPRIAAG